ncbi:MAG: phosphoribosylaminoimidazole-succinocarboxamide synthase [Bacillota bacterium]|jgi:phosphoribosylaminoimidazole-succinocarboxamide synthase|nr:phosphoribosylaminoimidazole-succinocarboxamide synthase [Bacillota bacterium]MDK2882547.1 phosphoribosylaminoimidazole-succinocarboxamide synthase [Bacillota bacterium]MDK2924246.1 phosphoribosylaminoimidazole-succinocarboxamide synthase [Bacillota bacterium]
MEKREQLYEGKAKIVYRTDDPERYIVYFKDDATAFNGLKKGTISGKGELNNRISAHFFALLEEHGIPTHFEKLLSPREMLVKKVTILPIEVVVRNIAAGSLAKRLGLAEGTPMRRPVLEFYLKSDELGDPMINEYHIYALNLASEEELRILADYAFKINAILSAYLAERKLELVDFKLEFGRTAEGEIILADEISPDTCRFWDAETKEKLDKDRFRRDLGSVEEAYQEIWRRLS